MSISFYEYNNINTHLTESFICENSNQECNGNVDSFNTFAILSVVATTLFAFAPVVAILFVINPKTWRKTPSTSYSS